MKTAESNRKTRKGASVGRGVIGAWVPCLAALLISSPPLRAADAPLVLQESIAIPDVPVGPYSDHLAVDVVGKRLFVTPQAAKAVAVLDLTQGRVLRVIKGVGNPHGIFFSQQVQQLFVTDGASGDLKVFSGSDYSLVKTVGLTPGADAFEYDPHSKFIYVNNGGEDAGMDHGIVTAVDTVSLQKVADIPIATARLESLVVDSARQLLYVEGESELYTVDLHTRKTVNVWKSPEQHRFKAIALDPTRGRLYVVCRDTGVHGTTMRGSIIVLNTATGQPVTSLPIGGWADGVALDAKRRRIYVSSGLGYIETYTLTDDTYLEQAKTESDLMGKTSVFSPELDRLFVSVPHLGDYGSAAVLVFEPAP